MKADKKAVERLLKTARGQVDGILKMVDDDRYCIDISTQLLSVISVLKKVNSLVVEGHLNGCIKEAFKLGDKIDEDEKVAEIMGIIEKIYG